MVTTHRDVVDQFDGLTSLREAVAHANRHPGPDTIMLDASVLGKVRRTLDVTGWPLILSDAATTTIVGPGANRLTINGGGKSRVFDIQGGSLALSGMTIAGGIADRGGGLRNEGGTLTVNHVVIRNSGTRGFGGGLYNSGTATLSNVLVHNNRSRVGGGVANFGTLSLTRVTIRGNLSRIASNLFNSRTGRLIRGSMLTASRALTSPTTAKPGSRVALRGVLEHRP